MRYGGGIGDDGRFLLHGPCAWYHENGSMQREASYRLGRLIGLEKFYDAQSTLIWSRDHRDDGSTVWTTFWPDGKIRTKSNWRDSHAESTAVLNDPSGHEIYRVEFERGLPVSESGDPGEY